MAEESDSRFYARVFWLTATALLALALLSILKPFFESILWAGLLAFLLAPVTCRLTRAFRGRRSLAALLVTLSAPWWSPSCSPS
jgi:predicted PurR-regulated permease PerM